ncbi:MAG: serine/threonine protein kinase, partial [Deltaproteobacteria bacterium]|nr:serine/threonine protein kinase [Deltaproteobacteria bacterium]
MDTRTFHFHTCLGAGGFGEVYRADMTTTGGLTQVVAVKMLRSGLAPASQSVERLRDEGRMLARLQHPVVLGVHDMTVMEGRVALVTEYVEGQDLDACFTGEAPLPSRALLQVIGQVADALYSAWEALCLVHRDIKPSNIRLGTHGQVKLLDFGIARSEQGDREAHTATNMMVGSLPYMAPERFATADIQPAADVFA